MASDQDHSSFPTGGGGGRGITLCEFITTLETLHDALISDGGHCGVISGVRFVHTGEQKGIMCEHGDDGSLWLTCDV
jgi:hypothetical protein